LPAEFLEVNISRVANNASIFDGVKSSVFVFFQMKLSGEV
jgi:hypothetical protein